MNSDALCLRGLLLALLLMNTDGWPQATIESNNEQMLS